MKIIINGSPKELAENENAGFVFRRRTCPNR